MYASPNGTLTTYDSYPERCHPDRQVGASSESVDDELSNPVWSQPLGWLFTIRIAWPNAIYPDLDHLMQKMVRLDQPVYMLSLGLRDIDLERGSRRVGQGATLNSEVVSKIMCLYASVPKIEVSEHLSRTQQTSEGNRFWLIFPQILHR